MGSKRVALVVAALLLAGLGRPAAAAGPDPAVPPGQVLRLGNGAEPETLDPHRAFTIPDNQILQSLYEGLLTVDAAGKPVPGAAASWTVSADGMVWRFQLRADGKWSDGSAVTADDFVFAWRRAVDPTSMSLFADILYPVANAEAITRGGMPPDSLGVRADGNLVLEVRLERPKPNFSDYLYHRATYPLHRASLEKFGPAFTRPGNLVGNGAYVLAEHVPLDRVALVRNPHFHDAANVAIERVHYYVTDDMDAELRRFRAGELDVTLLVPPKQLGFVRQNLKESLRETPLARVYFVAPNLTREPWKSNAKLRRALSLALDREVLSFRILEDGQPTYSFVPPGLPYYQPAVPDAAHWTQAQREAEAKRLFTEAGYGQGEPLSLELMTPTTGERRAAVAIAAMWQRLGVRTRIEAREVKVWSGQIQERSYPDMVLRFWQWLFPERFLDILRSTDQRNGNGYSNPDFDAAMAEADRAVTNEAFAAALRRAEAIALEDAAVIPISVMVGRRLVSPRVKGWQDNLRDAHLVRYLSLAP